MRKSSGTFVDKGFALLTKFIFCGFQVSPIGHGLLVYRIDYSDDSGYPRTVVNYYDAPNNTAGKPGITIVPADGLLINYFRVYNSASEQQSEATPYSDTEYRNSFAGDPYPGSSNVTEIKEFKLNRTTINKPIYNIKEQNGIISFDFLKDYANPDITNTYTLSITASGNGSVSYEMTSIKNDSQTFSISKGTNVTIWISPNNGNKIASVKINNEDVTSSVTNNQYTINNISTNIDISVTFEQTTTHVLSFTVSGNGEATLSGTTLWVGSVTFIGSVTHRESSRQYTFADNSTITILLKPDDGYRVASVKVNYKDVTTNVSNNQYTLSNISTNTTIEVTFEAIPTTYSLSITASGNGSATYNGTTARNQTRIFTVDEGTSATISFSPDDGYRIACVKVNNTDVTASISNNQYTISNISANTTVAVTFEAIPPTTYSLSITASGNGGATYSGTTARNQTRTFTVNEGTSATVTFAPDDGHHIASVMVNNVDVTAIVTNSRYTVSNITSNTTLTVTFDEDIRAMTVNGVNYTVTSTENRTVNVARGSYGLTLTVPASFTYQGQQWQVTGMDSDALSGSSELAAVVWNPAVTFPASISNPNFLLYVTAQQYAPTSIGNVVVDGRASSITLHDMASGNNFYCPQAFTATSITYDHSYNMTTGIGTAQGWETIALPFDVQDISHATKGTLAPFAKWAREADKKPFWLYRLSNIGFVEADGIAANTPYIISIPNNPQYHAEYNVNGTVTFSASNATVKSSDNLQTANYGNQTFVPNFTNKATGNGYYVLNAANAYAENGSGYADGSMFVQNLRAVHPFEAYITLSGNAAKAAIPIFEDATTRIRGVQELLQARQHTYVYNINGQVVRTDGRTEGLAPGVYIVNGRKVIIHRN